MANILIVDDSPELLELFTLILSADNKVYTAKNIAAAEARLNVMTPDIIFMDVNLEREDGRQFCYVLSLDYAIPVVLISADPDKLDHYSRYGAIAILEKPFVAEQIKAMVQAVVGEKKIS